MSCSGWRRAGIGAGGGHVGGVVHRGKRPGGVVRRVRAQVARRGRTTARPGGRSTSSSASVRNVDIAVLGRPRRARQRPAPRCRRRATSVAEVVQPLPATGGDRLGQVEHRVEAGQHALVRRQPRVVRVRRRGAGRRPGRCSRTAPARTRRGGPCGRRCRSGRRAACRWRPPGCSSGTCPCTARRGPARTARPGRSGGRRRTPAAASSSRCGVRTSGWPAHDRQSARNWSRVISRTLGRVGMAVNHGAAAATCVAGERCDTVGAHGRDDVALHVGGRGRRRDHRLPLERRRRPEGDRGGGPRHGRARRAVPPPRRGARRRRLRGVRPRSPRSRAHRRVGRRPRRPRGVGLGRPRRRSRHARGPGSRRASRHPAGRLRSQHGLVRAAAVPARPQRRRGRRRAVGHDGARRGGAGDRPDQGGRPERVQPGVRTGAHRLRLVEPRRRRGRRVRRRPRLRLRARPGGDRRHAGSAPATPPTCPPSAPTCRST